MAHPGRTTASAPGKAVLLGEYAVLEGAPALVAAVNRRAQVSVDAASGWSISAPALQVADAAFVCAPDGSMRFVDPAVQASPRLNTVRAVVSTVQAALAAHGAGLRPCHIAIDTAAFLAHDKSKLGLGSSAAVSVAAVAALLAHHEALESVLCKSRKQSMQQALMRLAAAVHARAQGGMGSGIDIAASVYGGVLRFERRPEMHVTPCANIAGMDAVFVWAGHATSTQAFLTQVRGLKARDPARHAALMDKLGTLARAGADAWQKQHVPDFLAAVATAFVGLSELGRASGADIVSAAHRNIARVVASLGGVYKSSGAGGGDLGVAFACGEPSPSALSEAIARAGFCVVPLAIDPHGVQVDGCSLKLSESR